MADETERTIIESQTPEGNGPTTGSTEGTGSGSNGGPQAPRAKSRGRLWFIALGVIAVFLAVPYWYTSNPESCTRCHEMKQYYTSWQKSSHSAAADNCFECHVKPGAVNLFIYRVSFYREIYASMVGASLKPVGAMLPGVQSCQRDGCHSLNRMESSSGDIKINHKLHITKAHVACTTCHQGAAHPNVGKIASVTPARKLCKTCHAARMNNCSYCHIKPQRVEGYRH